MKYDGRVCKFNMDTGCVELLLRAFCPVPGAFFVSGRQRFLKTQPNCKKSYNFLIKKGGFPLTALL